MTSVGSTLRSVRERQGRAIAEIADELCLTHRYLRAIEENDLKNLPGTFFYKSYVKQYAALLGLDAAELSSGIEALTAAEDAPPATPVNAPNPLVKATNRRYFSNRSLGGSVAGLAGVLFACSAFYTWWERPAKAVTIQPVQQVQQTPVAQTALSEHPAVEATSDVAIPSVSTPVETVSRAADTDESEPGNRVALNLSATEKTWLSITSGGKKIFSGVLEPSQTKVLTGLDAAKMKVGNAGGLEVELNGKPIGPIGPRGETRVVVFTPDNFQILPSTPPPSAESL